MMRRLAFLAAFSLNLSVAVLAQATVDASDPGAHAPTTPSPESKPPQGLTASDWSTIQAAYETGQYKVFPTDGTHRARNPGQRWSTSFDGRGTTTTPDTGNWSWGLSLMAYGWPKAQRQVARPLAVSTVGARLAYDWDARLTEWYVNDQRGLEHGYTVHERAPNASGCLTLSLTVRGGLLPEVSKDGHDVNFVDDTGGAVLRYAGLKVLDQDGKTLAATWQVQNGGLLLTVEEQGARYPLTIDPIAQQAYLKASNSGATDYFGQSVSVSGDTVVVGAYQESSNATGVNGNQSNNSAPYSGAAYVFVRNGTSWTQQAYLKASNTETVDHFGYAVSVSGDTIVVGAYFESSNATGVNGNQNNNNAHNSGAAYVFVRNGTTWTQQAYLKASNTGIDDYFGFSVSVSGDTVVVGALGEGSNATGVNGNQSNNSAGNSGAAYVFVRNGTTWTQQAYLKASNTDYFDFFAYTVSVSGDTIVAGAFHESSNAVGVNGNQSDNSAPDAGAAYVFVRNGTTWSQQAYLKASNTDAGDAFGWSVSVSGDTVVVGASVEGSNASGVNGNQSNNSALSSGAAYVFVRNGTTWTQQAYLKASNTDAGDHFGYAVSVSGDWVVVGAYSESSNATGVNGNQSDNSGLLSGAAYLFVRNGTTWSQHAYLKASNTDYSDHFGAAVSVSGDTVVVGAPWEGSNATGVNGNQSNNSAPFSGAAYVYRVPLATATVVGTGCGSTPLPPTLAISVPVLGQTMTLSVTNAVPLASGMLYVGLLASVPLVVVSGCEAYLDLGSVQPPLPFATDSLGSWSTVVSLPQDPALAGQPFALQAVAIPSSSPIGLDLTNAVGLVFGY